MRFGNEVCGIHSRVYVQYNVTCSTFCFAHTHTHTHTHTHAHTHTHTHTHTHMHTHTCTFPSNHNNYGERLMAFFNPHASGLHTFFMSSDDQGGLWMAQGNNITETERFVTAVNADHKLTTIFLKNQLVSLSYS